MLIASHHERVIMMRDDYIFLKNDVLTFFQVCGKLIQTKFFNFHVNLVPVVCIIKKRGLKIEFSNLRN